MFRTSMTCAAATAACLLLCAHCFGAQEATPPPGLAAKAPAAAEMAMPAPDLSKSPVWKVERVVDGDTVVVSREGSRITVRLIGVDTPETKHPSKPVQAYGKEASRFTENLLQGESVCLEYDQGPSTRDKYGRTLAYVFRMPDGLFVNLEIVRQGYGHAYTRFPFRYMDLFRRCEKTARDARKGLWADDEAVPAAKDPAAAKGLAAPSTGAAVPSTAVKKAPAAKDDKATGKPGAAGVPAASAPPATVSTAPGPGPMVYVTRTGQAYHREGCRSLSRSRIPMPLREAAAKYRPCLECSPQR